MSVVLDLLLNNVLVQGALAAVVGLIGWRVNGTLNRRKGRKQANEQSHLEGLELSEDIRRRASAAGGLPDKPSGKRDRD